MYEIFWSDKPLGVLGLHASASLECGSSKHAYHVLDVKLKRKCEIDHYTRKRLFEVDGE